MAKELPQFTLLRVAAFLVDALAVAVALVLPATILSYLSAWFGSIKAVTIVWYLALLVLLLGILFRDGYRGRSPGKGLLGLQLATQNGKPCGYGRSFIRNLPLLIPGWNLVELYLVLFGRSGLRTGDRIAKTRVVEE